MHFRLMQLLPSAWCYYIFVSVPRTHSASTPAGQQFLQEHLWVSLCGGGSTLL